MRGGTGYCYRPYLLGLLRDKVGSSFDFAQDERLERPVYMRLILSEVEGRSRDWRAARLIWISSSVYGGGAPKGRRGHFYSF